MGLLDDAIREHMELKRLRGADPSEVARQEQDALGPVLREEDAAAQAPEDLAPENAPPGGDDSPSTAQSPPGRDLANVVQETAELDMRTVLDEEQNAPETVTAAPTAAAPVGDSEKPVEDVLEETPDFLRDTPEQERLWFEQRPPRDFDFDK
jgi:hypothetical protein